MTPDSVAASWSRTSAAGETLTRILARFVAGLDLEMVPDAVAERAAFYCLDTLSVALAGSGERSSRIVQGVVERLGGRPDCTVIGTTLRTSPALAALANGAITHAVELDDDHRTSVLHPGTVVFPAALAAAEHVGASGKRFLEGVIAGYEVTTRIGDAFLGQQYYEGFHSTGTCGVFGAAAAAGRIMGLDQDRLTEAFGIAGTQAAGLGEWKTDGSWIKRLHPGKSAEAGILAVMLAKDGFTGPATIIEGEHGFLKAFSHERRWDVAKILDGLGREFRGHGTSFKPYACCRFSHQVVDAALEIVRRHRIRAQDIDHVEVRIHSTAFEKLFLPKEVRYQPKTVVDAQFSIPYILAVSFLYGPPMPLHFTDEMIQNSAVLDLASRIRGLSDAEYEKQYPSRYPTLVTVRLRDGKQHAEYRDLPSGDPENPNYESDPSLFGRQIREKIEAMLMPLARFSARVDELSGVTAQLRSAPNLSNLTRLLQD